MTAARASHRAAKPAPPNPNHRPPGESYGAFMLRMLEALDRLLVSRGMPAISAWWWKVLRRFYLSGRRRLVVRGGRRLGKSSTMCKVAVVEALFGEHVVPYGDRGVYPIVAQNTTEAANRLRTIAEILDAMRVDYKPLPGQADGWEVTSLFSGRRVAFQVFAATIAGVSGFTGIGALLEEVAKWRDRDTNANPATEVLRSIRPTMATTRATAKELMISSPFATLDAHYEAFEEGDTEEQIVAHAATWEGNPTLTEEETHRLERDHGTWLREYAAVPMAAGTVYFFDHDMIDVSLRARLPAGPRRTAAGLDPAFRRNAAACVPTARVGDVYGPIDTREIVPQVRAPLVPGPTIRELASWAKRLGCDDAVSDIHYIDTVIEEAAKVGVRVHDGFSDKEAAHIEARAILNAGGWALDGHADLAKQLKGIKQKPTPSGRLNIFSDGASTSSHGDTASAFIEAVWFLAQGGGRIWLPSTMARGGLEDGGAEGGRWSGCGERGF